VQERVLKVLQVWSDWFLFSDAYVNGLKATFLRSGNSGVPPFHSILGDVPLIKDTTSTEDIPVDSLASAQDAALAIGEGAATKELMSLPLAELERRCKHNGLSLRGGKEVMVARLLSLGDAEKLKSQEQDDGIRSMLKYGTEKSGGDNKWGAGKGWADPSLKGYNSDRFRADDTPIHGNVSTFDGRGQTASVPNIFDGQIEAETSKLPASTFSIPPPDLKAFKKTENTEPVLPASKWTRDEEEDEDMDKSKGLGLSYSSSEGEDMFDNSDRASRQDLSLDSSLTADTMDEERR
jgi:U2-associated protein SR140